MNKHLYRLVWRHCRVDVVPAPETACQRTGTAPASRTRAGRRSAATSGAPASALTRLCLACVALLSATVAAPAWATCTVAGSVVTCSGAANPLAPSFSDAANSLQVNVNSGAGVGVLLGIGGTAMTLTGNNVTLVNGGTIDPSVLGSLGLLASGTVIGNGMPGAAPRR